MSERRRVASVLLGGLGLVFMVPPVYITINGWRAGSDQNWSQLFAALPCCSLPAAACFVFAWKIHHPKQ